MQNGQNGPDEVRDAGRSAESAAPQGTHAGEYPNPHLLPPSKGSRWWLWPLVLGLVGIVFVLQRPGVDDPARRVKIENGLEIPPPAVETTGVFGKLALAMNETSAMNAEIFLSMLDEQAIQSKSPTERFRAAVLAAEVYWNEPEVMMDAASAHTPGILGAAGPRISVGQALDQIESQLDAKSELHGDIASLRAALAGHPPARDSAEAKALVAHHGRTLGVIASTVRDPKLGPHDPASEAGQVRATAIAKGWGILTLLGAFGFIFVCAALAGVVILIVVLATRRPHLIDPRRWDRGPAVGGLAPPGGETVWLEMFGVFVGSFLVLKLTAYAVERAAGPGIASLTALVLQWALVLTLLWPMVRGVKWADYRRRMGYHAGRGVLTEVGCGLIAYIAAVPLLIGAAITALIMMLLWRAIAGESNTPLPENRLMDMVGGSIWQILFLGTLAVIWAPLVEEGIFRGALFRHLRRSMPAMGAALVVGFFFAVMHGYMIFQLIVIMTLGTVFAIMREWRGSIIPSMTAHATHNAMVLILLTTLVTLAKD